MASTNGPELVPGDGIGPHGVEVLKLLGDRVVVEGHSFVEPGQDLLVCHFLGRYRRRAFGHLLSPLSSSLGKTEWKVDPFNK